ncbi:MAG: hypothetical protein ACO3UU_09235 [Minisyncoccia bacterium]
MNTQNNVFIITSTINTTYGLIPVEDRYQQTLSTINSIRKKDNHAVIILIDNSTSPLIEEKYKTLSTNVTYFLDIGDRSPCKLLNKSGVKGAGEAYMLLVGLDLIKEADLEPKRIFKISGRYILRDTFDINYYSDKQNKYVFKERTINEYGATSLHTRLWSSCGMLIEDMKELVSKSFCQHIIDNTTIEETMFKNIDKNKLLEVEQIHCEGLIAPWNILINE